MRHSSSVVVEWWTGHCRVVGMRRDLVWKLGLVPRIRTVAGGGGSVQAYVKYEFRVVASVVVCI